MPPDPFGSEPSQDPSRIDEEFARLMEGLDLDESVARADEPEQDHPLSLALLVTPIASAKALAGAVRLDAERTGGPESLPEGLRVLACDSGALILVHAQGDAAHELAQRLSEALRRIGLMLFIRADGNLTATRYRSGERGDDVSPALVLGGLDPLVEQILLGGADDDDLGESIDPRSISRVKAMSWVALGGRGA